MAEAHSSFLRRLRTALAVAMWCLVWPLTAAAAAPTASDPDPLLDEHVARLTAELRCVVCQNQSIADSQADLAMQLKREVRQQLMQGASEDQVREFMVQRYGDFVLYRPPVNRTTLLLWAAPALLLLLGGALLAFHWRERRLAFANGPDSELPAMTDDDLTEPGQAKPAQP